MTGFRFRSPVELSNGHYHTHRHSGQVQRTLRADPEPRHQRERSELPID
ncbi:hypothetical protein QW131_19610 [Roseibium salinum]|nr:hypothetical protein [Roseibium salinum]